MCVPVSKPACLCKKEGKREGARCARSCWWVSISAEVTKYPLNVRVKCSVGLEVTETAGGESKMVCSTFRDIGEMSGTPPRLQQEQHLSSKNTSAGQNLSYG